MKMMRQMFWDMRCGDEEGVVRFECEMKKRAGRKQRELDHLDPVMRQRCSRRALTLQR